MYTDFIVIDNELCVKGNRINRKAEVYTGQYRRSIRVRSIQVAPASTVAIRGILIVIYNLKLMSSCSPGMF